MRISDWSSDVCSSACIEAVADGHHVMAGIAQRLGQELPHRGLVFGKKDLRHDPVVRSLVPRPPAAPSRAGPHPPRGDPRVLAPGHCQYKLQAHTKRKLTSTTP